MQDYGFLITNADFQQNFRRQLLKNFETGNDGGNISEIDERLAEKLTSQQDVGPFVDRIENNKNDMQ